MLAGLCLCVEEIIRERVSDLLILAEKLGGDRIALIFFVKVWYDKSNNEKHSRCRKTYM